ncbi:MAG: type III PLP-dependent enzyme [Geminicoccaceae bacterium]|nr:type III PLP-dependent enzyme [Geminicoccaceae bacterium]
MIQSFGGAAALISALQVDAPVLALRRHILIQRAREVVRSFPGDVLYAVKCNAHPAVLEALYEGGVRHFDTASIAEIRLVRELLPDAQCHFMHPVKSRRAISEAYHEHGVRRFVVDHVSELEKLFDICDGGEDLEVFVRLAVCGDGAVLSLEGKFGATQDEAVSLLRRARAVARSAGITFHVGSQSLSPVAFVHAIRRAAEVAERAGGLDHLDVGGGFPARYIGDEPEFDRFVTAIEDAVAETGLVCNLQCEPGRLLVADGASVLARVEMRRGRSLFINDGVYGNLAELKWIGPQFPARLIRPGQEPRRGAGSFDLYGPTCDSIDSMPGPHWLPEDVIEGDWVEIGMTGAYSNSLGTDFNGMGKSSVVFVDDGAWYNEAVPATDENLQAVRVA